MAKIAELGAIPAKLIRADQAGDWMYDKDYTILAYSAQMDDERSELAVAIHELIEAYMCRDAGVTDEQVTKFDFMYERERAEGKHGPLDEAGDDERAPYRVQHEAATIVEKSVCFVLGLSWKQHEVNVAQIWDAAVPNEN
jgi:hypothetical protein